MKLKVFALILAMLVCACVLEGLFASPIRANSSSREEHLAITKVHCSVGSEGWFAVTVNNVDAENVTITLFSVNGIKQASVSPVLPAVLATNESLVINASLCIASEGTYRIDLLTLEGNRFSVIEQTTTTG
jgi:hypothetical protein